MKKITRTITLILEIDWEDYGDVDEQLILDDAIREVAEGVRISIHKKSKKTVKNKIRKHEKR